MQLGRLQHDPVAVAASPALPPKFATEPPPPVLDRSGVSVALGMYDNDTLPVCTGAMLANAINAIAALSGYPIPIPVEKVLAFYAGCVGCAPTPQAIGQTNGAILLSVMRRQVQNGFDIGQQVPMVGLFGHLPLSRLVLANCIAHIGVTCLGVTLREADMKKSGTWDNPVVGAGGIVGGHAIVGFDYSGLSDSDTVRVATWGRWKLATWSWLEARIDEAYGILWRSLLLPTGTFWNDEDFKSLNAAMNSWV